VLTIAHCEDFFGLFSLFSLSSFLFSLSWLMFCLLAVVVFFAAVCVLNGAHLPFLFLLLLHLLNQK